MYANISCTTFYFNFMSTPSTLDADICGAQSRALLSDIYVERESVLRYPEETHSMLRVYAHAQSRYMLYVCFPPPPLY